MQKDFSTKETSKIMETEKAERETLDVWLERKLQKTDLKQDVDYPTLDESIPTTGVLNDREWKLAIILSDLRKEIHDLENLTEEALDLVEAHQLNPSGLKDLSKRMDILSNKNVYVLRGLYAEFNYRLDLPSREGSGSYDIFQDRKIAYIPYTEHEKKANVMNSNCVNAFLRFAKDAKIGFVFFTDVPGAEFRLKTNGTVQAVCDAKVVIQPLER